MRLLGFLRRWGLLRVSPTSAEEIASSHGAPRRGPPIALLFLLGVVFFLHVLTPTVFAEANNKFGIHLAQPNNDDIDMASDLVNSNGGKWGYITLVLQENDRDLQKWQDVFERLREKHLIPLIRLATHPEGASWRKPEPKDIDEWVTFLNKLNWVVKDRYIVLFNETNHGAEWGGSADPEDYADIAKSFAERLRASNHDYFVMLAGFDASAPTSPPAYLDETEYLRRVVDHIGASSFNELFSGLSSHSYPNPAFAGSPNGYGKGTVRTYQWELDFLRGMGVKDLPVFITETGWDAGRVSRNQIAYDYTFAFNNVWGPDDRVKAVTPFVLSFLSQPFINFSWTDESRNPFPQFMQVKELSKENGAPAQIESGAITGDLPTQMTVRSSYHLRLKLENTGQAIWDVDDDYHLVIGQSPALSAAFTDIHHIKPRSDGFVDMLINTGLSPTNTVLTIQLKRGDKTVMGRNWQVTTIPLPQLSVHASFYPKLYAEAEDAEVQIFNKNEELVYKEGPVIIHKGIGVVSNVPNIVLGERYRVVLLRKYYLPRQTYVVFKKDKNEAKLPIMMPLDFNADGKLDGGDLEALLSHLALLGLLIPSGK